MTRKQQMFIKEYLVDLNATQAAIRAGYSAKTANEQGARMLANASIKAAVQEEMDKRATKLELTADKVLSEISYMAFYDPADFAGIKNPDDIAQLPEHVRKAVVGWSWDKAGNFVIKLSPKTPSQELLGRHLKLFTDKLEVEVGEGLAESIQAARERAKGKP